MCPAAQEAQQEARHLLLAMASQTALLYGLPTVSDMLVSGHVTTCTHSYLYVSRYLYVSPFIAIYKTPLFTAINKMVSRGVV